MDVPRLIKRLRKAGNTIISKKGATEYGPSYAISNLISTIITDSHKILTVTTYLNGEIAGVSGVSLGVPVVLSKKGIAMIVPIHMNDYETKKFQNAAEEIRKLTDEVRESLKEEN
jgi:malate dehydrogenase